MSQRIMSGKHDYKLAERWFQSRNWKPFNFQRETWHAFLSGESGLLNAPTGSGKSYALWIPCVLQILEELKQTGKKRPAGLMVIWVTPLRALAKDLKKALKVFCSDLQLDWEIEIRTGDTPTDQKSRQVKNPPTCLITTPESLHILFSQKKSSVLFQDTTAVVVDEWHELLGTKRGVQTELALARIKTISNKKLKIWGISATIGNLEEAAQVLMGAARSNPVIIKADIQKKPAL